MNVNNNELVMIFISIFLIALCCFILIFNRRKVKYLENIPGPPTKFLFGNTLDFLMLPTEKYLDILTSHVNNYGGIVKVKSGPLKTNVLVTDKKFLEYILSSTKLIDKARDYVYLQNWFGTGLLTSTGAKWKQRRRIITPAFHYSILEQFIGTFERLGDILVEKLIKHIGRDSVDMYPFITLFTLDVICEASMGTSVDAQNNENSDYVQKVKLMCKLVIMRTFSAFPDALYFLRPMYYKEKKALKVLHSYTDSVIDKKIKELPKKNSNSAANNQDEHGIKKKLAFLDLLLQSTIDEKPLSKADLREEVDTFMFAGHDTTSSAISFILYELANNPVVQQKVIEEQKQIFNDDIKNVKVTTKELSQMKYLELVIKETLRMYPSVPYYARENLEDFEYEGTIFPKGLTLVLLVYVMQRSSKYYPEPNKFIPERFEMFNGKDPFIYLPFSAGPRNCIGQKFAMLEMKSTVSKIVRKLELLPSKPRHVLQLASETILLSTNGVHISFKTRE